VENWEAGGGDGMILVSLLFLSSWFIRSGEKGGWLMI